MEADGQTHMVGVESKVQCSFPIVEVLQRLWTILLIQGARPLRSRGDVQECFEGCEAAELFGLHLS